MPVKSGKFACARCGGEFISYADGFSAGFGTDDAGHKFCYNCCAERDKEQIARGEDIVLYLSRPNKGKGRDKYEVTNWPGTLRFDARCKFTESRHAIWSERTDVWFHDHNGFRWYGRLQDKWGDAIRFRRLKKAQ